MKKFTKLFLSCAAVAALTAALAVSASAEALRPASNSTGLAGTYDEDGTLTITAVPEAYTDAQQTILVLEADTTPVAGATTNIRVIDQVTNVTTGTFKLDTEKVDTANKTYYVLLGGTSGNIYQAEFGKVAGIDVLIGDANQNGEVDGIDARCVLRYDVGDFTFTGNGKLAADANLNGEVDGIDARCILRYDVGDVVANVNDKVGMNVLRQEGDVTN